MMMGLEVENYHMILGEKQLKFQHYHQVKLINMNNLQVKKYSDQSTMGEQTKFTCSSSGAAFEKQLKPVES